VSPVARRAAAALHVDVEALHGTGPGGAVSKRDVERAAHAEPEAPAERGGGGDGDRAAAMRAAIAALMARSKREIPHYYLEHDIDMSPALAWMREHNASRPISERMVAGALLLKAAALAAREVPELNGFWVDDSFRPGSGVHLGVAVSLKAGGLVAPAIHDADAKPLGELMSALRDLTRRARAGRLRQSEMSDPTLTVTSLGDQGVDAVHGVIYPPQVALVGFGRVSERPWARDGMVGAREIVRATLAGDHRASDGYSGARFLRAVERLLQTPEEL
jgi:pyruvate dehydrogenase E2 component (dihydrolipoamide acetyltransferase)